MIFFSSPSPPTDAKLAMKIISQWNNQTRLAACASLYILVVAGGPQAAVKRVGKAPTFRGVYKALKESSESLFGNVKATEHRRVCSHWSEEKK